MSKEIKNELDAAFHNLTLEQMKAIEKATGSISGITCKLGLTRSYVHSYIRKLNGAAAR